MAAKDVRVALSFGYSNATDDISRTAKHDSGMLLTLRDGQVQPLMLVLCHLFCKPLCQCALLSVFGSCIGYPHQEATLATA